MVQLRNLPLCSVSARIMQERTISGKGHRSILTQQSDIPHVPLPPVFVIIFRTIPIVLKVNEKGAAECDGMIIRPDK